MDFRPRNPIYLQVADYVCEKVLTGAWRDGEKLPAVKDLSVITTVNPNTVIRSLGYLVDHGILTTQRGVGYFLTGTARENTLALKRRQFTEVELPRLFATMELLGLKLDDLERLRENRT